MSKYIHFVTDLESDFATLGDALAAYAPGTIMRPRAPYHALDGEDRQVPRISVSTSDESALSGIGAYGRLKRCCSACDGAKSYASLGNEVYPILRLILEPNAPAVRPTKEQVPDADITNELWLTSDATIRSVELRWLDAYSLVADLPKINKIRWVEPTRRDHPWINGRGEILISSMQEPLDPEHRELYVPIKNGGPMDVTEDEDAWDLPDCYGKPMKDSALERKDFDAARENKGRTFLDANGNLFAYYSKCPDIKLKPARLEPNAAILRSNSEFIITRKGKNQ